MKPTVKHINKLREQGMPWEDICEYFGAKMTEVRGMVDPAWLQRRRDYNRTYQEEVRKKTEGGDTDNLRFSRHIDEMKRRIPQDTRGLTARMFGDPLPGRSALDMRGTV